MTEEEARERVARLTEESPDRATHSWLPREGADGRWSVVKIALPSPKAPETVNGQAAREPVVKDDPRSSLEQRFPPWGAGI